MELRQLRDFVALAEELHYARAAARLGIDQSPLSRRIKEFERELGVLLFARTSRGTQLTPRGEILLPWARSILSAADHAAELVRAASKSQAIVRVAMCDDVPSRLLLPVLGHFQQASPGVSVLHLERSCAQQADELLTELIDVGFGLFSRRASNVSVVPLWTHPAYAVLPAAHPLGQERQIESHHLKDLRIGLIAKETCDPTLHSRLEALAHLLSENADIVRASSLRMLMSRVLAKRCVGIVGPAQAEMIQPVDFVVRPIAHLRSRFTTSMCYRTTEQSAAVRDLVERVRAAAQSVP